MPFIKNEYFALNDAGQVVDHDADYDTLLVRVSKSVGAVDNDESPAGRVLIVQGSRVTRGA